jgi:hypothetical protein
MKVLADARRKLGIEWGDPNNQRYARTILDFQAPQKIETSLFLQYVDAVNKLWKDEGIQTSYDRRREFQLVGLIIVMNYSYDMKIWRCLDKYNHIIIGFCNKIIL